MYRIDPARTDLAREFRDKPFGRHSAELQMILNLFRSAPLRGNYCLVCTVPHREWRLARFRRSAREPVDYLGPVYRSLAEAEWDVFKLRWRAYTGHVLEVE